MKVVCDRAALLDAVNLVAPVVAVRSPQVQQSAAHREINILDVLEPQIEFAEINQGASQRSITDHVRIQFNQTLAQQGEVLGLLKCHADPAVKE